jgi:hypothetical protein
VVFELLQKPVRFDIRFKFGKLLVVAIVDLKFLGQAINQREDSRHLILR